VTAARLARKNRDTVVAWVLMAAAAAFLTFAKGLVKEQKPRAPSGRSATRGSRADEGVRPTLAAELDLEFVDQVVAQIGRGKEAGIPLLQAIQNHYRYLPDEALRRVCELTEITPAEIAGTSSFYGQFRRSPVGEHIVRVCHGTACHVSGARQITEELRRYLGIPAGQDTDAARLFTLDEVACLGCCSLAPVLMVDGHTAGKLTPATACEALKVRA
jgi:NADH:ubiquinone oxidoreductase subunit E